MKSAISEQSRNLVPLPNRGGIGTHMQRQNGTGTTHQNRVGTGTDPSGTDTTTSCSLDFCILTLLSPNSYTNGIGTLIND